MKSKEILKQIKEKYWDLTNEITNLSIHELLLLQMENDKTIGLYDLENIINKLIQKLLKEKIGVDKKEESYIDFIRSINGGLVNINARANNILYYNNDDHTDGSIHIKENAKTIRQIGKTLLDNIKQLRQHLANQSKDNIETCIDDLNNILISISILNDKCDGIYTFADLERFKLVKLTLENVIRKLKQEGE